MRVNLLAVHILVGPLLLQAVVNGEKPCFMLSKERPKKVYEFALFDLPAKIKRHNSDGDDKTIFFLKYFYLILSNLIFQQHTLCRSRTAQQRQ